MPDYSKGKIYKIYNDSIPDKVYYGSTVNTLTKRFGQHKDKFHLCTSKQLFPNAKIVLVEKIPCNDKDELTKRERWYIENNECVNKYIPGRTQKEYREDNKDKKKQYYQANKKKFSEQSKKWSEDNKDKIKEKRKKYRETNKEKIKEKQNQYYETKKEKIGCKVCKSMVSKGNFSQHCKTKKHQSNLGRQGV